MSAVLSDGHPDHAALVVAFALDVALHLKEDSQVRPDDFWM
jgi:hypothetical protein